MWKEDYKKQLYFYGTSTTSTCVVILINKLAAVKMEGRINQPLGQKLLTNVAIVEYTSNGKRFELACYRNKAIAYRNGIEKSLDEVLQTPTVFSDAVRGIAQKTSIIQQEFSTTDQLAVCKIILQKGRLQVSAEERKIEYKRRIKEVANIVSEWIVNTSVVPHIPYPSHIIESAMINLLHYHVNMHQPPTAQAAFVIKNLLERNVPLKLRGMEITVDMPVIFIKEFLLKYEQDVKILKEPILESDRCFVTFYLLDPKKTGSMKEDLKVMSRGLGSMSMKKTFTLKMGL